MTIELLLWICLGLIVYCYAVFPLIIGFLALFKRDRIIHTIDFELPSISILMSVHNEEFVLKSKIDSLLKLDYPEDRLEIIIGSDASDDNTNKILQEASLNNNILKYKVFLERSGKPEIINKLVSMAGGEIIVITDANVFPERESLKIMAQAFCDRSIGLVDAFIHIAEISTNAGMAPRKYYNLFEAWIKRNESIVSGSMMGPSGGYYALRKKLYKTVPPNFLVDDFHICMNVIIEGSKSIIIRDALATESEKGGMRENFRRMIRISSGNFQNLARFSMVLLKPWRRPFFTFISHKVLRWFTPWIYLVFLVCNILLIGEGNLYNVLFYVQLIFLLLPALDLILSYLKLRFEPVRLISHFIYLNIAMLIGFIKFLRGIKSGIWEPTKRR